MQKHKYLEGLINSLQEKSSSATVSNDDILKSIADKNLVVYFYPKDSTPGCTLESNGFAKYYDDFKKNDTEILGISRDSVESHAKFKQKQALPFELIADINEVICKAFDVLKDGKLARTTFLFDKNGELVKEWRKVKVLGHAKDVFTFW